jgi:DNA polymerase I-like protein with 3'-5' exonuclease and polymerase domains
MVQALVTEFGKRIAIEEFTRQMAKRMTYAAFYGASPKQLAVEINADAFKAGLPQIDPALIEWGFDRFFTVFRGVRQYQQQIVESILRYRRVRSLTGRERTWHGYLHENPKKRYRGPTYPLIHKIAKEGWSFPPQDMAAWVLALALERIETEGNKLVSPRIHVHDELVIQIPESPGRLVDEALALIRECMTVTEWGMVFPADVGDPAPNWLLAK